MSAFLLLLYPPSSKACTHTHENTLTVSDRSYLQFVTVERKLKHKIQEALPLLQIRGLGLPQAIEIDQRPDKKFRQGFTGAPETKGFLACSATGEGCELVP